MNTLIDFVRFTKSWEYVIAICAVFSFLTFWAVWRSATSDRSDGEKKTAQAKQRS